MTHDESDTRATVEVKKLGFGSGTWMVVPPGGRGGIAFPSRKAAEEYCAARNYRVIKGG